MLHLDTLDLRKLRAFHLVGKHGGLRFAASRLKQSIPAISGKIHKLEKEIGFDLFERLPNKLVLTVAGERFLREVDGLFERAEQALSSLASSAPEGRLTVSVGSDHAWFYAAKFRTFLNRHPNAAMSLRVYRSAEAIVALDQGEIDVGFGIFPQLPKRLIRTVIERSSLSIAYNPKESSLRKRPTDLDDLALGRMIIPPASTVTRRLIDKTMKSALDRAATVIEAPTCETAATFVEMGVGVAVVHTLCIERHQSRHVQSINLGTGAGSVEFCAVHSKAAQRSALVRALLDEVQLPEG